MSEFYEGFYLANNPDVAKAVDAGAFGTGWEHYSLFGQAEGRSFAEPAGYGEFNEQFYLASNADVAKAVETGAFGTGWEHYSLFGQDEGRSFAEPAGYGEFNEQFYLANNADVALAVDAGTFGTGWEHYSLFGQDEGRSFAEPAGYGEFNELFYLASNADVAKAVESGAFATGWQHYQLFGEAEGRTFVQPEPVGEAILQETAFAAPDEPAPVEGETFTLTEAMAARAAGELPAEYTIEDNAANLVDATTAQEIITLDGAAAINVTGTATVAQMDTLLNVNEFTNVGSYTLSDSVENLLAEGAAAIVADAVEATVAGEPTLTVAEYNEIAAIATVATYTIEDSAANVLEAGAEAAALVGADSILLTDAEVTLAQALELDDLGLDIDYTVAPFSLEEALAVEALPAIYTLTDDVYAAGEVDVETATATYADVTAVVEGAQNDPALEVADVFTWSVADTLANLEAADAAVLDGADAYALTNEAGALGELSGAQYALVDGATNTEDYTFTVVPAEILSVSSDDSTVVEGNEISFTVELSYAVNDDREIDYVIEGVETSVADKADPLTDLGQVNGKVTVAAGETTATITLTPADDGVTEGLEAFRVKVLDESFEAVATSGNVTIQDAPNAGQTFTLTTSVDEFVGGAGNDTFRATVDDDGTDDNSTWSALDSLDGGAGTDTLRINDVSTTGNEGIDLDLGTITNIETMTIQSVYNIGADGANTVLDLSGLAGLTTVNTTKSVDVDIEVADTTAINVSGATGDVTLIGGSTQTVTAAAAVDLSGAVGDVTVSGATGAIDILDGANVTVTHATAGQNITIGDGTDDPAGTITVTDSDQGTGAIAIDGGTDVTVDTTITHNPADDAGAPTSLDGGDLTIGATTGPSGAINVTHNLNSDGGDNAGDDLTGADITTTGGTTVDITVNADISAKAVDADGDIAIGAVTVNGGDDTTAVTVTQNTNVAQFEEDDTELVEGSTAITFKAMSAGEALSIDGLSFHATTAMAAEDVAQAFSNLDALDTQDAGGPTANGYYTGALTTAGLTSGSADGATVSFSTGTATAPSFTVDDYSSIGALKIVGYKTSDNTEVDSIEPGTPVKTEGTPFSAGGSSTNTITYGVVKVGDAGADSITTVTIDGYDDGTNASTVNTDKLATLSLANSGGSMGVTTAATSLDLTVNNVNDAVTLAAVDLADLTLNAVGSDSTFALNAVAVTDVAIDAAADLDLSSSTFTALENATIAGAGAVVLGGTVGDTLATIDAANNEGGVTATVKGNVVVTGGTGDDEITVSNDTITKAINLGAGNDTLTLAAGTTAAKISATVDGGDGTDTLAMGFADAVDVSATAEFHTKVTGFEVLEITDAAFGADVASQQDTLDVNLENLAYTYVITNGTTINSGGTDDTQDILQLTNIANDSTVELNGDGLITVVVEDAADGETDTLNVVVNSAKGELTVADVETINIDAAAGDSTFVLTADSVESIVITGDEFVNLTNATDYSSAALGDASSIVNTGSTLTLIDASGMIDGGLVAATNAANQTIKGGAGVDHLTAANAQATIYGGDGDDFIYVTNTATSAVIDGGAGADTFDITGAALGVEAFATFNNVDAGDTFMLNAASFSSEAVDMTLDDPSTSDWINAAFAQTDGTADEAIWFQHGGNTYIVDNSGAAGFDAANDVVVRLTGLVDLGAASFNATDGTLEIA